MRSKVIFSFSYEYSVNSKARYLNSSDSSLTKGFGTLILVHIFVKDLDEQIHLYLYLVSQHCLGD